MSTRFVNNAGRSVRTGINFIQRRIRKYLLAKACIAQLSGNIGLQPGPYLPQVKAARVDPKKQRPYLERVRALSRTIFSLGKSLLLRADTLCCARTQRSRPAGFLLA
jgi:hypothetical protein